MSKTTAIYVRVSHRDQTHASQLPDLERWGEANDGPVLWFKDTFTGRTMNRPGMDKMLAALRSGKLCRIVVWRLDRLGRTTKGLCQLFDELCERDVDLVSLKDGFSLESPAGRLHARILASVAEYETEVYNGLGNSGAPIRWIRNWSDKDLRMRIHGKKTTQLYPVTQGEGRTCGDSR